MNEKIVISIITVNFFTGNWIKLLVDSVKKYTTVSYEIIVTDNSSNLEDSPDYIKLHQTYPCRHWLGITEAMTVASGKYILLLDSDSHIMRNGWDIEIIKLFNKDRNIKLVACRYHELYDQLSEAVRSPNHKGYLTYFRPFAMFFQKQFLYDNKLSFMPYNPEVSKEIKKEFKSELGNVYFDVGVYFALKTLDLGYNIEALLPVKDGYKCIKTNKWGTSWTLNGIPTFYHHGYSSRFKQSERDVCGRTPKMYLKSEQDLFKEFYG